MISTEYDWASFWNVVHTQNCNIPKKLIHAKLHKQLEEIVHAAKRSWLFISNIALINFFQFRKLG